MKKNYLTIPEMAAISVGTIRGLRFRVAELDAENILQSEQLEDAVFALDRLATGAVFGDPDRAVSWARGIAVSALDEIER